MDFKKSVLLLMVVMLVALSSAMAVSAVDSNQTQNFGLFKMYIPDNVDFQIESKYNQNNATVFFYKNCNDSSYDDVQDADIWILEDLSMIPDVDDSYKLINQTNDTKLYQYDNGTYYIIRDIESIASIGVGGKDLATITDMVNSFELADVNSVEQFAQDGVNEALSQLNATLMEA